jgi:hypothetical protein
MDYNNQDDDDQNVGASRIYGNYFPPANEPHYANYFIIVLGVGSHRYFHNAQWSDKLYPTHGSMAHPSAKPRLQTRRYDQSNID